MRHKFAVAAAFVSLILPLCAMVIMQCVEEERVEAFLGGGLAGCLIGSVLGVIALILNRGESRLVKILSIIPMCPLGVYMLLFVPYILFR